MPDVITGTYADFKLIKTRNAAQLIIEIPIERAQEAIELLGMPNYGAEVPVAVARLKTEPESIKFEAKSEGEMAVQRAGILCGDEAFQRWAFQVMPTEFADVWRETDNLKEATAQWLRWRCGGISSRREIATNEYALLQFQTVEADYRQSLRS